MAFSMPKGDSCYCRCCLCYMTCTGYTSIQSNCSHPQWKLTFPLQVTRLITDQTDRYLKRLYCPCLHQCSINFAYNTLADVQSVMMKNQFPESNIYQQLYEYFFPPSHKFAIVKEVTCDTYELKMH